MSNLAEIDEVDRICDEVIANTRDASERIKVLADECAHFEAITRHLRETLEVSNAQIAKYDSQMEIYLKDIEDTRKLYVQECAKLAELQSEHEKSEARNKATIFDLQQKNKFLERKNTALADERDLLKRENTSLASVSVHGKRDRKNEELKRENEALKRENEALKRENEALKRVNKTSTCEIAALKEVYAEIERKNADLERKNRRLRLLSVKKIDELSRIKQRKMKIKYAKMLRNMRRNKRRAQRQIRREALERKLIAKDLARVAKEKRRAEYEAKKLRKLKVDETIAKVDTRIEALWKEHSNFDVKTLFHRLFAYCDTDHFDRDRFDILIHFINKASDEKVLEFLVTYEECEVPVVYLGLGVKYLTRNPNLFDIAGYIDHYSREITNAVCFAKNVSFAEYWIEAHERLEESFLVMARDHKLYYA